MEDNIDKLEGEDESDSAVAVNDDEQEDSNEEESFIQRHRSATRNIDDDNAEAAEMAKMEDNIDKLEGEDESDSAVAVNDDEQEESNEEESFIQRHRSAARNIDDDNAQAAEMAKM